VSDLAERVRSVVRDVPDFPEPGILFRDIAPIFADPDLFAEVGGWFASVAPGATVVAGIEARGFLLGGPAALAARLPFVPVRKAGKLPGQCHQLTYDLEYGTACLEVQVGALKPGDRVLILDDVLATGGTARATADLVTACGATPIGLAVLLELGGLAGRDVVEPLTVTSLLSV
jgi:adenine phosphoribosyltransferase